MSKAHPHFFRVTAGKTPPRQRVFHGDLEIDEVPLHWLMITNHVASGAAFGVAVRTRNSTPKAEPAERAA